MTLKMTLNDLEGQRSLGLHDYMCRSSGSNLKHLSLKKLELFRKIECGVSDKASFRETSLRKRSRIEG